MEGEHALNNRHEPDEGPADDVLLDASELADFALLDPTTTDSPPTPGSTRYLSILEHSMTLTNDLAPGGDPISDDTSRFANQRPRRRLAFVGAAAAILALLIGIAVVAPGSDPTPASAAEALAQAAETTGEVTTLRVEATYDGPGSTGRIRAEGNGADYRIASVRTYADGPDERETLVQIGDTVWDNEGKHTAPPDQRNAAYAPSSEAVVKAILDGSTLEDLGDQDVRGVTARHIRATLTPASRAALAALSPSQVAMFELENPDTIDTLDLWIAHDLIRRIRVATDQGTDEAGEPQTNVATIEFYDFGADITITPPS